MTREVIDILVSYNGNPINIYEVKNENVDKDTLKEGCIYEVTYKFGRGNERFTSKYLDATDNLRSLRFEHPTKGERYSIYVPFNNILSLRKIY